MRSHALALRLLGLDGVAPLARANIASIIVVAPRTEVAHPITPLPNTQHARAQPLIAAQIAPLLFAILFVKMAELVSPVLVVLQFVVAPLASVEPCARLSALHALIVDRMVLVAVPRRHGHAFVTRTGRDPVAVFPSVLVSFQGSLPIVSETVSVLGVCLVPRRVRVRQAGVEQTVRLAFALATNAKMEVAAAW
jgi:hypothetical protein